MCSRKEFRQCCCRKVYSQSMIVKAMNERTQLETNYMLSIQDDTRQISTGAKTSHEAEPHLSHPASHLQSLLQSNADKPHHLKTLKPPINSASTKTRSKNYNNRRHYSKCGTNAIRFSLQQPSETGSSESLASKHPTEAVQYMGKKDGTGGNQNQSSMSDQIYTGPTSLARSCELAATDPKAS